MDTQDRQLTKKGEPLINFVAHLSKEEAAAQGDRFFAFRDKTRIRILDLLVRYGGRICVSEIAKVLDEQPPVISRHLATLRAVGLVSREPDGAYRFYTVNAGAIDQYTQFLEQYSLPHGVPM